MPETQDRGISALQAVSSAMIRLHREQFGRGPRVARSYFAGADVLVCILEDVLLPAERKMVELGSVDRVRETRIGFQAATQAEFTSAVEEIVERKVRSFASGLDPVENVAFEMFYFERRDPE